MKRRLLAFLLAFVMTFSLVPVNTFAAEADAAVHYTNITTESGENVTVEYVETVVGEAAWGESINTPYYHVTIPEGTGKVLLTYPESVKLVLSGDDGAVFFYRNTYPGQSEIALGGALTVATNDDGSKTVTIPVESFMRSAAGSVAVGMAYYVDGENQSAAEFFDFTYAALTHAVTLTSGEGYTLTGEATAEDGKDYTFTVTVSEGYDAANMVVKVNGEEVTAVDGIYTVEKVSSDLAITVEGVTEAVQETAGLSVLKFGDTSTEAKAQMFQLIPAFDPAVKEYTVLVRTMKCSTGKNATPTPKGTFQNGTGPGARWHYFKKFKCWAQYAYYIEGDIMFHSVLYKEKDGPVTQSSVNNLGRKASHGCIRLSVEDAKWINQNCPRNTKIIVY